LTVSTALTLFFVRALYQEPVKIFVCEDHVAAARALLQDLDLHAMAISLTTEQRDDDVLGSLPSAREDSTGMTNRGEVANQTLTRSTKPKT
jgi:hypothetical protein